MSQLSLSRFSENLPVSGTIAVTQAATGCGLGLLLADKMSKRARRRTSAMLLTVGVVMAVVPIAASFVLRHRNRPHSRRRAQRQLESIRGGGWSEADAMV